MSNASGNIDYEELLVKHFTGEINASEEEQLQKWLSESEANKQEYEKFKSLWEGIDHVKEARQFDADSAWKNLSSRIEDSDQKLFKLPVNTENDVWNFVRFLRIAALLVLVIGAGLIVFEIIQKDVEVISFSTHDETANKTLPDGSIAYLNANSTISFPGEFSPNEREVELKGEAFFEVKKNGKTFVVKTGKANVKVVGTSFNVKAYPDQQEISVIVKTGKVEFFETGKKDNAVLLAAGEKAVLQKETNEIKKSIEPLMNDLFWKSKTLTYQKTRLGDIVSQLNEFYGANITLSNQKLADCQLTTSFHDEQLEHILEVIALTFNLEIVHNDDKIILKGERCQ